jgi:hypothetical protein
MTERTLAQTDAIQEHAPTRRLSCLEAMTERRGDIVCFTPALLVTHGHLPADPIGEFVSRFNVPAEDWPFCVELNPPTLPFFTGLGMTTNQSEVVNWDRRLYAVPKAQADNCINFLGGIGISGNGFFASAVTYELNIPDPTMPQFNITPHLIPVVVFGVLVEDKLTYLSPNGVMPPFVKTIPAKQALERVGNFKQCAFTEAEFKKLRGDE